MDDDQQFCLRWNNHQSTLISVFDTLLENGTLVDCTLAAEGKFLKAHKVVLSACSVGHDDGSPGTHLGLATVLLARGASTVIGATVDVPDEATSVAMTLLHKALRTRRPASALAAVRGCAARPTPGSKKDRHAPLDDCAGPLLSDPLPDLACGLAAVVALRCTVDSPRR